MDDNRFDALARQLSSRRTAIGGLVASLLVPLGVAANGKHKKHKRKKRDDTCWRGGSCQPRLGANVSRCNLEGSAAFTGLNCTGCNISRANLRGVNARGANFAIANLSGSCLVNVDFTGTTFAATTNLANATFCRTIMPDGSINNSGCAAGTECCPTCIQDGEACGPGIEGSCCGTGQCINGACQCIPATCESLGNVCGMLPDGCGGTLNCQCGTGAAPYCVNGVCLSCAGKCGANCACVDLTGGATSCYGDFKADCSRTCSTKADCPGSQVCASSVRTGNTSHSISVPQQCGRTSPGICLLGTSCNA